jgi:hypothetical protein
VTEITHLTNLTRWKSGTPGRAGRLGQRLAACTRKPEPRMVTIYEHPENEPLIDCDGCLAWLRDGDNRLLVTEGGMDQWIANHINDGNLYYMDIPADGEDDGPET